MTYVIGEPCIDVQDRAFVDEYPVDFIYEGDRWLYCERRQQPLRAAEHWNE